MPIVLPSSFDSREEPHSSDPYLWLLEIELQRAYRAGETTVPGLVLRAAKWHQDLTWPPSHPDGWTWQPWNFAISPVQSDGEGNLPGLQVTVDNTTKALMRYLHSGAGLEGNDCTLFAVPQSALSIAYPNEEAIRWDFQVLSANASSSEVTFRLGHPNFFEKSSPQDRFAAARCRWAFGSRQCGYVINAAAAYTTCPKTFDACVDRGDDHVARGLPRVNPRNFGGFPGVAKQR